MPRRNVLSTEERAQRERFEAHYLRATSPVMRAIERSVCGCDYGGNSWTTRVEADRLGACLRLAPSTRLLDLGSGSGWPALYLAKATGCEVTLVDLPLNGLRIAAKRIGTDGLVGRAIAVVASAAELPFADGTFDAITHSDLLCCLLPKRAVLAACRQVVRERGRMAFTVISVAPGLSAKQYQRAVANGPPFIETDTAYPTLLAETGWIMTEHSDVTLAYAESCDRQLAIDEAHEEALTALIGRAEFDERVSGWRSKRAALEDGLLRRDFLVAVPRKTG